MQIDRYTECAVAFAKDTRKWARLDSYKMYVTSLTDGWEETCDNSSGGYSVEWAFRLPTAKVREQAAQRFIDMLLDYLDSNLDLDGMTEDNRAVVEQVLEAMR